MFCPNCGLQQPDATNFCKRCGVDLTEKRSQYDEIAATATPPSRIPPSSPPQPEPVYAPGDDEEEFGGREDECGVDLSLYEDSGSDAGVEEAEEDEAVPETDADEGQLGVNIDPPPPPGYLPPAEIPPAGYGVNGPQRLIVTQKPKRVALPNLGLRRLVCFPTFIGCLGLGAFSCISSYDEIIECIDKVKEPSFGWGVLATMVTIVALGILQALIGMGTIYSSSALATAFVMSAICAFVGLNYLPGTWKERLIVFIIFAICALAEATSAIGPIEKKPKPPKQPKEKPAKAPQAKPTRASAKTTKKSGSGTTKSKATASKSTTKSTAKKKG